MMTNPTSQWTAITIPRWLRRDLALMKIMAAMETQVPMNSKTWHPISKQAAKIVKIFFSDKMRHVGDQVEVFQTVENVKNLNDYVDMLNRTNAEEDARKLEHTHHV
jgi:hypothetical protein